MSANVRLWDCLEVCVLPDSESLGSVAAADAATRIGSLVAERGVANVMLATGNSQLAFLAALTEASEVPWPRTRIFHMDEYVGLPPNHPAGFGRYIRQQVTERVHPMEAHYVLATVSVAEASRECSRYADLLGRHPIDLCVMGIGENGHLAFNDPPVADFDDPMDVKVVSLDEACRNQQVGEGHFPGLDAVPTHAITVTIPTLLRAGQILVICPEARKADAVRRALTDPISTACPASVLRRQAHARLYLDRESAQDLPPG